MAAAALLAARSAAATGAGSLPPGARVASTGSTCVTASVSPPIIRQ